MLEIVMRAGFGIMTDEILTDEIRRAAENGATIIQPELDIHDILTIDPGLTAIAMDYGWSRAAEVCTGASAAARAQVRDVYQLRRHIWSVEDRALRPRTTDGVPDRRRTRAAGPVPAEIADLKHQLRDLVDAADSGLLPPGGHTWWRDFERHPYPVQLRPDWIS